jgi:hypothetical protein
MAVIRDGSFKAGLFAKYLADRGIPWPKTESGRLQLDQDTFRDQAKAYPAGTAARATTLTRELRIEKLALALTDATAPCSVRSCFVRTKYTIGQQVSSWSIRMAARLIKPGPGRAVAYIDWSSQEVAIAAALSGDPFPN